MTEQFDAIVIGAGHAGCEAALALARLSCKTALFTVSVDSIAMMPCNPNVGGTSKGHLVREIDALGGEMGKNIDRTFIQSKMLNQSKGPAVHSLRAQADKKEYSYAMRKVIEETDGVSIKQGEITDIIVEDGKVYGYFLEKGQVVKREYLYLHFKRRKMQINVPLEADKYLIVPSGFEPYKEVTDDVIKHYAKKKWFYPVFWEEVKKSIVRKFTKNNGR